MSNAWDMDAPVSGGKYLKIKDGQTVQVRFVGEPIVFEDTMPDGEKATRFASAVLFRNKEAKTNEVRGFAFGWTIQKAVRALKNDEDYGDPSGYDIAITRTGEGMSTKYSVIPKPAKALTPEEKKLVEEADIDLKAMFVKDAQGEEPPAPKEPTATVDEYDPFKDE